MAPLPPRRCARWPQRSSNVLDPVARRELEEMARTMKDIRSLLAMLVLLHPAEGVPRETVAAIQEHIGTSGWTEELIGGHPMKQVWRTGPRRDIA